MSKLDELIASGSKTVKPKKRKANDQTRRTDKRTLPKRRGIQDAGRSV